MDYKFAVAPAVIERRGSGPTTGTGVVHHVAAHRAEQGRLIALSDRDPGSR